MSNHKIEYDNLTYKDISDILESLREVLRLKYGVGVEFHYFTTILQKNESDDLDTIGD